MKSGAAAPSCDQGGPVPPEHLPHSDLHRDAHENHPTELVYDDTSPVNGNLWKVKRTNTIPTTETLETTLEYATDDSGLVVKTTDPEGQTTERVYDEVGRVVQTTDARGGVVDLVYDVAGNMTELKVSSDTQSYAVRHEGAEHQRMRDPPEQ